MGEEHTVRYLNLNNVPNTAPSVITSGGVSASNTVSVVNGGYYVVCLFHADKLSSDVNISATGGDVIARSPVYSCMDTGKGGRIQLAYIRATSTSLKLTFQNEGAWVNSVAFMRLF
jgi:hypothetical protein